MTGARILIYGGSGAIGSAIGRRLRARGCELHLVARDARRLAAVGKELGASFTAGDVNDVDLFGRVAADVGEPLDGLVYAVGTINLKSIARLEEGDLLGDFKINAMGAALAVQAALPALRKSAGVPSVLFFSSVAATQGFAFHASIGMAKAAVSGLTLALAAELAPKVRVNAIAPSLTRTPMAERLVSNDQVASSIAALHARQRLGTPDDVAPLADLLLSPDTEWITGQIIGVDGGRATLRTRG